MKLLFNSMLKSFPHYTQLDEMDCGVTCLRMIAKHYGKSYSNQTLRERSFITRSGVSLLGLSEAAESIGFRTIGAKISFRQLVEDAPLPCILHWNQNHFVVLYKVKGAKAARRESTKVGRREGEDHSDNSSRLRAFNRSRFYISDPAGSKYTLTKDELLKCWASTKQNEQDYGVALMLEPTPDFYGKNPLEEDSGGKKVSWFFRYLRPFKSQIAQIFVGLFIGSILALIFPFLTQSLVDQGIGNHNLSFVTLVLIAQLVLFCTQLAVGFLKSWISLHVNTRIGISIVSDFLSKLMRLPLRFFDAKNVGDIMQRIGDNERVRSFLTGSSISTLFSFFNFIVFACILAYYNLTILAVFVVGNLLYMAGLCYFYVGADGSIWRVSRKPPPSRAIWCK